MAIVDIKANYGAVGDGQIATAVLTTNGTGNKTLTSGTSLFIPEDVGKKIAIQSTDTVSGSNPLGAFLTTISAFTSGTIITLQDSPPIPLASASKLVEWGTNDNTAFTNFKTANAGSNTTLTIPAGRYCFAGAGSSNGFGFGIPTLQITGSSSNNCTLTDMLGVGNGFFMGGALVVQTNDATHSARLQTVSAGSSTLTLLHISDASLFSINTYALITGYDTQNFGYPTNPLFKEWVYITGISGTTITLRDPLRYTYKSTWPTLGSSVGPEVDQAGPATLYALASQNWDCDHSYSGITFVSNYTVFNSNSRNVTYSNCKATAYAPNISQAKDFTLNSCDLSASPRWEIDKLNTNVNLINSNINRVFCFSASADLLTVDGCTLNGISSTPKNTIIKNSTLGDLTFSPESYGAASSSYCDTCVIGDLQSFGGVAETDIFGAAGYSYSNGVFTRARAAGTGSTPQWANPGFPVLYESRHTPEGSFLVTDVTEDATNIYIQTNLTGSFPPPIAPATTFIFRTHPSPVATFINCTGSDAAVAFSNSIIGRPLYSGWNLTYTGNIGTSKSTIPIFGKIVYVKFTVNSAYTTGTFNLDGPFVVNKANNTDSNWNPVIDLTRIGTRTITPSGVTGGGGADNGLVLPGSGQIWLVTAQITPKMSSATGSGSITLEIITDQGFTQLTSSPLRLRLHN